MIITFSKKPMPINSPAMNINPHNIVFNNNEGVMSINIQHKYIYDSRIFADRKFNRKIEFNKEESAEPNFGNACNSSFKIVKQDKSKLII